MTGRDLLATIGMRLPVVQAPMAGVSTPAMAAAVSHAGGLGSLAVGALSVPRARSAIAECRARSSGPLNVNVFCHAPPARDRARESAWLARLAPHFARFHATPPDSLHEIYRSFVADDEMLTLLLETRPRVVSFHFGLPARERIAALQAAGIVLFATATSLAEGQAIADAGVDAVVAQGVEAGGHRGVFDPEARDERLSTRALSSLLVRELGLPVIAAGGIMDGRAIAAALGDGAVAAQLGTAFLACPESAADAGYRTALARWPPTTITRAISGRPARSVVNDFTALGEHAPPGAVPAYPLAYDAGKALHAAATSAGESGYGAHWAGAGLAAIRALPAAALVERLALELRAAVEADGRTSAAR